MAIRLPGIKQATQILRRSNSTSNDLSKGYCAVYVGETQMNRYVIPVSLLNQASFQELLSKAEEEFGFNHPNGGLTIPCSEGVFVDLISYLTRL